MTFHRKQIRQKALDLLGKYDISDPPVPVDQIAHGLGITVKTASLDSDISGFLYRGDERTVIGVNADDPPVRRRFTVAHEIAHFLLHPEGLREVHVDRKFFLRSELSSKGTDEHEVEANFFAAELLMPSAFIARDMADYEGRDLVEDKVVEKLAKKYKVSEQALVIRLTNLGFIKM
jgi:Zn-dependent peptidase ImmA (M78 family)